MLYLLIASVLWAPSFGLIKHNLGDLDSSFVAWARMLISFAVFAPLLRFRGVDPRTAVELLVLGAVQFGLMYLYYIYSYVFLPAHIVALFTIFTPLYVTAINDLLERRFHRMFLLTALLAVAGTALIVYLGAGGEIRRTLAGFALVQVSNICFAFGQIRYKMMMAEGRGMKDSGIIGLMYLGAVIATTLPAGLATGWFRINVSQGQLITLLYLGIVPSGLCFLLWNIGATRANAGTLAIFNNAKIPLGMLCALWIFAERVESVWRLVVGGAVILLALVANEASSAKAGQDTVERVGEQGGDRQGQHPGPHDAAHDAPLDRA